GVLGRARKCFLPQKGTPADMPSIAPLWKMAMMTGWSFPVAGAVWANTVRFRNEGAAAKLASATPDDLRKSLRVTAMLFLRPIVIPFFFHTRNACAASLVAREPAVLLLLSSLELR